MFLFGISQIAPLVCGIVLLLDEKRYCIFCGAALSAEFYCYSVLSFVCKPQEHSWLYKLSFILQMCMYNVVSYWYCLILICKPFVLLTNSSNLNCNELLGCNQMEIEGNNSGSDNCVRAIDDNERCHDGQHEYASDTELSQGLFYEEIKKLVCQNIAYPIVLQFLKYPLHIFNN